MNFELDDDEQALAALCRDFAEGEIAPIAADCWATRRFPAELFDKLGKLDLMGLLVPEQHGGIGASTVGFVAALEQLARVDQSIASAWQAHTTIGSLPLLEFGNDQQRDRWLRPLAEGRALGAFGLTEPQAGSDAAAVATIAKRDGDSWKIDGSKIFITNAGTSLSYGVVVLARVEGGYANFVIERDTPGYTIGERLEGIGWRSLDTRPLYFDDVVVTDEHRLGDLGSGLKQFLKVLEVGRISIATMGLGLTSAALEISLAYAKQRQQFGKSISSYQAIQFKLAHLATELEAARWLTYRAAALRDAGRPFRREAAMAKLKATSLAVEAASEAVQIHGGYGYMVEHPVARLYCDSKILEIGEGTNEIQHLVIARELGC